MKIRAKLSDESEGQTIKLSIQDADAKVSGNIGGTDFSPAEQIDTALPIGTYNLSALAAIKRNGSAVKIEVTSSDGRLSHRIYLTLTE